MKLKITLSIFLILACFNLGFSQEKTIEETVSEKIEILKEKFDLKKEQTDQLAEVFYAYELNYRKHINGKENDANYSKNKNKFDTSFNASLKKILGDEKFKLYLEN